MALETKQYQFGAFRLDAEQKLLFRDGNPVSLAPKAIETLLALVENSGRLVTKEALMKRIWPDAFVEDGNLTFNISQIRNALGDDRNNGTRFIETVPRRGYRFIAPVVGNGASGHADRWGVSVDQVPQPEAHTRAWRGNRWALILAAIAVTGSGVITLALVRTTPQSTVLHYTALTNDRRDKPNDPILSDGLRVYFGEEDGDRIEFVSVSAQGGAVVKRSPDLPFGIPRGISADQSVILVQRDDRSLWTIGPPSGFPRRVGEIVVDGDARWSPDRQAIAYSVRREVYVAKADGSQSNKVATAPGNVNSIRWSPDGKVLRFSVGVAQAEFLSNSIWEVAIDGSHLHPLLPGWREPPNECCGDWTADGRYYVFQYPALTADVHSDLWAIRERNGLFQKPAAPIKLTSEPISFLSPVPSPDGKRLFALGKSHSGELMVWDAHRKEFVPYMEGKSALWVTFSRDRSWIAYTDYTTHTLWRMQADGSDARQLSFEPLEVDGVAISPDDQLIAFRTFGPGAPSKIYLVQAAGGQPQPMIPGREQDEGIPSWSLDGKKIVFGDVPAAFGQDDGTHAIRVYDLVTHELSSLPGSNGLWTARWSPDGRYICALKINNSLPKKQDLWLYDIDKERWRDLGVEHVKDPIWSHDSKYVYFGGEGNLELLGVFRVRVSDGMEERVAPFGNFRRADGWVGLAMHDSPITLRDIGTEEIYSLDVNWR